MSRVSARALGLGAAMAVIVAAIAGLAYWDAARESTAALQDFADEQVVLARALGAALAVRTTRGQAATEDDMLAALRAVERPRGLVIMMGRPGESSLTTTGGRAVRSARLTEALSRGEAAVRLSREEAATFGLPARTALAGLSRVDAGESGRWNIVAIASAQRERDRERWARGRLILSVLMAAGLVLAFGGLAMRTQRKELVLERELTVAGLQQTRDERLQRASKAAVMGTLAMGIAHEISTPLGVIAARAEQMLPKVTGDERLSASVAAILSQTDRINQVMRGLLGLARGDAPSAERIEPRALVENAVGLVEHRFEKAGVRLQCDLAADLPAVIGDPKLLEHAVVNLLLNACDACQRGGDVTVVVLRDDGGLTVTVGDSGVGISAADAGRAVEPFFTTKAREGGTGLGLAIAHEIVTSHRGKLTLSPGQPTGTRAAIHLPAAEATAHG